MRMLNEEWATQVVREKGSSFCPQFYPSLKQYCWGCSQCKSLPTPALWGCAGSLRAPLTGGGWDHWQHGVSLQLWVQLGEPVITVAKNKLVLAWQALIELKVSRTTVFCLFQATEYLRNIKVHLQPTEQVYLSIYPSSKNWKFLLDFYPSQTAVLLSFSFHHELDFLIKPSYIWSICQGHQVK